MDPIRRFAVTAAALMLSSLAAVPVAAAADSVDHVRDGRHHEIRTVYYPDDICGPRSGWTTYDVTWQVRITDFGDTYHVSYVETGTYETDFDNPTIDDYSSQFTEAAQVSLTKGGVAVTTNMFHDFPGSIMIRTRLVLVEKDGTVLVDRDVFDVSGCP